MENNVIELNIKNWEEEIEKSDIPVLVDFWADWCFPCKMIEPLIKNLSKKYKGRIKFGRLNVDENPSIAQKYEVMAIPTLILFKQGKILDRLIGAAPENVIEKFIKKAL